MNPVLVGQYSYTACEAPGPYSAVPGWKVKQVLSADFGGPVPEPPVKEAIRPFGGFRTPIVGPLTTQDEIDRLPRCLRLDVLPGGFRSLAHLAAAGRDRSGRDAFFAHGLLVGPPADGATAVSGAGAIWNRYRPADFWAADGWLTPFRAEAIETAELGPLPAVSVASPAAVDLRMDFIDLHPGQREFVLAAAERAFSEQAPIVILGLPVEAAMWTSIVTHFLLPSTGWAVPFSTYEAAPAAEVLRARPGTVIGAPADTAAGWRQMSDEQVTVLDPENPPVRTGDGFPLAGGTLLPVGPWARLAEAVCTLGWEDEVRRRVDVLGEQVGADLDPWPLFALPAAVLSMDEELLRDHREVARLAAQVLIATMPQVSLLPPGLTADLIAAITNWGEAGATSSTTGEILAALDRSDGPVPTATTDPILTAYVREVLARPADPATPVWFPERLTLSDAAADRLAQELPALTGWLDSVDPDRLDVAVLTIAGQVERAGLTRGPALTAVQRALDPRIEALVPQLLDGAPGTRSSDAPLARWLWPGVLSEAVAARLMQRPAGEVLWHPAVRRLVESVERPLPARYEPGHTVTALTLLDGERAAAELLAVEASSIEPARLEVLRTAAFLRSVLTGRYPDRDRPGSLVLEIQHRFVRPPRSAVLYDLLGRLVDVASSDDLILMANNCLSILPPDDWTRSVATLLVDRGVITPAAVTGPLAWHVQIRRPLPLSSHAGARPVWPDHPENELLKAVVAGRMHGGFREVGVTRLAWWLLLVAADQLDLPANSFRMESAKWFTGAEREPLRAHLDGLFPTIAGQAARKVSRYQDHADDLAAEWTTRAAMAQLHIPGDPAHSLFADQSTGSGWFGTARTMLAASDRSRDHLERWVELVRRSATRAGVAAYPDDAHAPAREALVGTAVEIGTQVAGLGGVMGWLRRSAPLRRS